MSLIQTYRVKVEKEPEVFSFTIPNMEIHASNEPVGIFITSHGKLFAYKIKTKGRYFVKNNSHVRGIYTINNKYRYSWGKTPVYFFAAQETNQVDPIMINELNLYLKRNQLSVLRRKDVKHGSMLRIMTKQLSTGESIKKLKDAESGKDIELRKDINAVDSQIDARVKDLKEKHQKIVDVTDAQKTFVLLEHLRESGKVDELEYTELLNKVTSNILTFDTLIDELREKHIVTVSEPLNENVEDFIQDLGAQNAADLAGFVQDLRQNKKGLKDLTPAPVKSFMPAGILFAIILGVLIGIPVIIGQLPAIERGLGSTGGEGGLKMPWQMFGGGLIYHLMPYLPNFMLNWLI